MSAAGAGLDVVVIMHGYPRAPVNNAEPGATRSTMRVPLVLSNCMKIRPTALDANAWRAKNEVCWALLHSMCTVDATVDQVSHLAIESQLTATDGSDSTIPSRQVTTNLSSLSFQAPWSHILQLHPLTFQVACQQGQPYPSGIAMLFDFVQDNKRNDGQR
jgi:hypothetical protein